MATKIDAREVEELFKKLQNQFRDKAIEIRNTFKHYSWAKAYAFEEAADDVEEFIVVEILSKYGA